MGNPGPWAGGGEPVLSSKGEYMRSNGLNHIYRVVWNAARGAWQAIAESGKGHAKSKRNKAARQVLTAGSFVLLSLPALAADILPSGGTVVAGALLNPVSVNNGKMTIEQASSKLAMDWQSFSIGHGNTVEFVQPSSSAVALNRVLGSDVSVIQGALKANGQVFLINPNGVLFTPTAQVDVGSLVASTQSIKTADFLAGKYLFEGISSNAIINQGNVTAANGGTIALIAAKIINNGTLTARAGNVLLGAGSKVTLDMGGPVKLQVENDTLETLISNGGVIRAEGGHVLLTSQAARNLASSVINNTGLIEAQTLATGEKGEIVLFAHGGTANIGGKLDASAPNGGDGGFIETSASTVSFAPDLVVTAAAATGKGGKWLIDPTDITIGQSTCTGTNCISADTIATTLNGGTDVAIETDAPVTDDYSQRGDINFNGNLSWNQSTLILRAHNDIWIRGNLVGTGTAKLGLEYGLGRANGRFYDPTYSFSEPTNATYTILGSLTLPAYSFYAHNAYDRKGSTAFSDFASVPLFLNNGLLRFGDGTQNSVDGYGSLLQPFYYNSTDKRWYKLTYSQSSMYLNVAWGLPSASDVATYGVSAYSGGTVISNQEGKYDFANGDFDGNASSYVAATNINSSGFSNGRGTLVASNTISDGGVSLTLQSTYTLRPGASYVEAISKVTNVSGASVGNVRLWSGTRDDFIATTDGPLKEKGNISGGTFAALTSTGVTANAIKVTSHNDGILFYSTSTGADTTIGECCSPNFHIDTANTGSPLSSPSATPYASAPFASTYSDRATAAGYLDYSTDGNYSVYSNFGSLANNASKSIAWYYAAGPVSSLASIISSVDVAAQAAVDAIKHTEGASTPITGPSVPVDTAIKTAQVLPVEPRTNTSTLPGLVSPTNTPPTEVVTSGQGSLPVYDLSGGLAFVAVPSSGGTPAAGGSTPANGNLPTEVGGRDPLGFMRVFVVGGGLSLPDGVGDNSSAQNLRRN